MKLPDIKSKVPNVTSRGKKPAVKSTKRKNVSTYRVERTDESRLLLLSIVAIVCYILIAWTIVFITEDPPKLQDIIKGSMGSVFALLFAVIIMDNINARSNKKKRQRDERKAIVRHNKILQPVIDMYLVRKNMVVTLNDKTVRKFKINADFTIKDMKDMYSPSELISDVGKSKIQMYAYYQDKLLEMFTHLVEDIDFNYYSDLCDAAMKFINSTSYGAAGLDAVLSYQDSQAGMKSMKSIVMNLIREEPSNGKFIDAPPTLKNVYLLHQMINEQETALEEYLRLVHIIIEEDAKEMRGNIASDVDYE
jgi:hypothetical protein